MLTLHHMGGSTCSQRVRLALAEKGLEWTSKLVEPSGLRAPAYLALNPAGVVPTLEHDGNVVVESRLICEYLEDAFPQSPLMPTRPVERHRARCWTKSFDDRLQLAIFVLSFVCWMRARYIAMPDDARRAALPGLADPVKRRVAEELLEKGWDSELVLVAMREFLRTLDSMDKALADTRWLSGDRYSLADIDMLAILQRLDDLGLASLWDERAAAAGWLERARSRPSFAAAFDTWLDGPTIQSNRERAQAAAEPFARLLAVI